MLTIAYSDDRIYPIYQTDLNPLQKFAIITIVHTSQYLFILAFGACMSMVLVLLMYMCEICSVESCLNELKGTYDENQDPMLAIDWTIT